MQGPRTRHPRVWAMSRRPPDILQWAQDTRRILLPHSHRPSPSHRLPRTKNLLSFPSPLHNFKRFIHIQSRQDVPYRPQLPYRCWMGEESSFSSFFFPSPPWRISPLHSHKDKMVVHFYIFFYGRKEMQRDHMHSRDGNKDGCWISTECCRRTASSRMRS